MDDAPTPGLLDSMLQQELYIVESRPARSPDIKKMLPTHLDYQIQLERDGVLFGAGPFYEENDDVPSGGFIIIRAENYTKARAIADQDPMHKNGLRSYTLRKWIMNEGAITLTIRYSDQSVVVQR